MKHPHKGEDDMELFIKTIGILLLCVLLQTSNPPKQLLHPHSSTLHGGFGLHLKKTTIHLYWRLSEWALLWYNHRASRLRSVFSCCVRYSTISMWTFVLCCERCEIHWETSLAYQMSRSVEKLLFNPCCWYLSGWTVHEPSTQYWAHGDSFVGLMRIRDGWGHNWVLPSVNLGGQGWKYYNCDPLNMLRVSDVCVNCARFCLHVYIASCC